MGCVPRKNVKGVITNKVTAVKKESSSIISQQIIPEKRVETNLTFENKSKFEKCYQIEEFIKEGGFSKAYKVIDFNTLQFRVLKTVHKSYFSYQEDNNSFSKEIQILSQLVHPNIVKIFEYFKEDEFFYLILEYLPEGDLNSFIKKHPNLGERMIADIFKQLISAVAYLHSKNIVHRDIKPENIILSKIKKDKDEAPKQVNLKLIDFGTVGHFTKDKKLSRNVGSPYTKAPEVNSFSYTEKCDLWSCGSTLYFMLTGCYPFEGAKSTEIEEKTVNSNFNKDLPQYQALSEEAKDLIEKLLDKDPETRISAEEALNHPWIMGNNQINHKRRFSEFIHDKETAQKLQTIHQNLQQMKQMNHVQKLVLKLIVRNMDSEDEEICFIQEVFSLLDKSGKGVLSSQGLENNFQKIFSKINLDAESETKGSLLSSLLFSSYNTTKREIEYEDFTCSCITKSKVFNIPWINVAFNYLDNDKDDIVTTTELTEILKKANLTDIQNFEMIKKSNQKLTLGDFCNHFGLIIDKNSSSCVAPTKKGSLVSVA